MNRNKITVEEYFSYLLSNHCGVENGIQRKILECRLLLSDRELRKYNSIINKSMEMQKIISTRGCIYVCDTKEECEEAIRTTYRTAINLFKKAKMMEKKVGLNNQIKLNLGTDYEEFIETFTR